MRKDQPHFEACILNMNCQATLDLDFVLFFFVKTDTLITIMHKNYYYCYYYNYYYCYYYCCCYYYYSDGWVQLLCKWLHKSM